MITITKQNDGVLFEFEDSKKYLYGNGSILVPFNTLSIVADESDMITLKKAASNDVFISARYNTDLGYRSKDDAIDDLKDLLFAETGGGSESGITSGEVQTMIDNSLEDYYTDDEVDAALSGKASISDVTAVANDVQTVSGQVATKVATSDFNAYSATTDARIAEDEEVTAAALNDLQENKADTSALDDYYEKVSGLTIEFNEEYQSPKIFLEKESEGIRYENIMNDGGFDSYQEMEDGSTYDTNFGYGTIGQTAFDQPESGISSNREFQITTDGFIQMTENTDDNEGYSPYRSESNFNYETGLEMNNTWTEPDQENVGEFIESSSRVTINNQKNPFIELADVEGNVTRINTTGITINDGQTIASEDYVNAALSGKADTSAVTAAIDAATSGKVDTSAITTSITSGSTDDEIPTAKAVYDATQSGGGGATYSAGTNISIDTGNTINCTLNLRNGTGFNSIVGVQGEAKGKYNFAFGQGSTAGTVTNDDYAFSFGGNCKARKGRSFAYGATIDVKEIDSAAFGQRITLNAPRSFSAGYHNVTNNWTNIALGEELTTNNRPEFATGIYNNSVTGSTASGQTLFSVGNGTADNDRHNAFEVRQNGDIYVNDGTNDVRLQDTILALGGLKLVKLTQSEYDNLPTKDNDTLYIISNVVS